MPTKDFVKPHQSVCSISVAASPGAKRTEISGIDGWRGELQVRIAAEPRGGAANEELRRFLAQMLQVDRNMVKILKGARSAHKVVLLPVSPEKARQVLEGN